MSQIVVKAMITITPIPAPVDPSGFGFVAIISVIIAGVILAGISAVIYILKWIKDNPIT